MTTNTLLLRCCAPTVLVVALSFAPPIHGWMDRGVVVDSVFHLLGGAAVATGATLWARHRFAWWKQATRLQRALFVAGIGALAGIGWEWYEFLSDVFLKTHHQPSMADTMKDLLLDVVGSFIFGVI